MTAAQIAALGFGAWFLSEQFTKAARRLDADYVLGLVTEINNREFGGWFDPLDVLAVAQIESALDPDAWRWESHLGEPSLGLMQLLFSTARDRGYAGGPAGLLDPVVNVQVGMRHLKWSHDFLAGRLGHAPDKRLLIGSYNAGVGNALRGRIVEGYVKKWKSARSKY